MSPSQLSDNLRRIATGIDKAQQPSIKLVAKDLRRLLAAIDQQPAAPAAEAPAAPAPAQNGLSPDQAADAIHDIANKLAASERPNPELLVSELKRLIGRL